MPGPKRSFWLVIPRWTQRLKVGPAGGGGTRLAGRTPLFRCREAKLRSGPPGVSSVSKLQTFSNPSRSSRSSRSKNFWEIHGDPNIHPRYPKSIKIHPSKSSIHMYPSFSIPHPNFARLRQSRFGSRDAGLSWQPIGMFQVPCHANPWWSVLHKIDMW